MSLQDPSAIRVAYASAAFVVRVEGRGTMRDSPLVQEFAWECLEGNTLRLVVDLSVCGYLDSTFLGCLVGLHQRFGREDPPRFVVAASAEQRQRLLAPLQLHRILKMLDEAPPHPGGWLTLCAPGDRVSACPNEGLGKSEPTLAERQGDPRELGRHLLECHRRLAELGGDNEAVFGPIVEQLACELQEPARPDVPVRRESLRAIY
jgi:anti-anti-sigma regulatory factor